ncbi:hypothetical protein MJO28_002983 [Puccinia striiformis f. sp. tritici]|uniref:Uncharacterized protein n=1 Tax=Puccinia striiformis f. sp. tritici TaxID=168172 RepID=A0ACC0ERW6_9BASI|nr:hypothetical protein MJO28_002983 [Puccinia striiformis f. sp. tritici]
MKNHALERKLNHLRHIFQRDNMLILLKIPALLNNSTYPKEATTEDQQFLLGYRWNTLLSYNTGFNKFIKFAKATQRPPFKLPLSKQDVYAFCYWAGRNTDSPSGHDIAANTLVKYLAGLQAWHLYHEVKHPDTKQKVTILIKSSAKTDANLPALPKKKAAGLDDVLGMVDYLMKGESAHRAMMDVTLVAFWGMASPNDIPTIIKEHDLSGACDPKEAGRETSLFGYYSSGNGDRVHITKDTYCRLLKTITQVNVNKSLTGHLFRVGGASLRFALGVSVPEICPLGRWTSDCYKLYLGEYSPQEIYTTERIIAQLDSCWTT